MPNYDFECNHCKKVFDAIVPIKDMDKAQRCACGGIAYRIFSCGVFGLMFKGPGFYETDYKNPPKASEAQPVKETSSAPYKMET